MDDVLAVMDAAGCERAALLGSLEGGPLAMLFAATHPDRVSALVLYATFARARWAPDYDWAPKDDAREARLEASFAQWGQGTIPRALAPSKADDPAFREWAGRMERYSASPGTIRKIMDGRRGDRRAPRAAHHPGAHAGHAPARRHASSRWSTAATWPSTSRARATWSWRARDSLFSVGDSEAILGEIEEFLTGRAARARARPRAGHRPVHRHRGLHRARRRDGRLRAGAALLERHDRLVRREIDRHRGRAVKSTGDGVLATFDGPARAVRAAESIGDVAAAAGRARSGPACTPARWRCWARTWAGWPCTSGPG